MVGSTDIAFDISNQGVHPRHNLGCVMSRTDYHQHSVQIEYGYTAFLTTPKKYHPEPFPQSCPSFVKDCSCGKGALIATAFALIQMTGPKKIGLVMIT
jgi:hypothetical protein